MEEYWDRDTLKDRIEYLRNNVLSKITEELVTIILNDIRRELLDTSNKTVLIPRIIYLKHAIESSSYFLVPSDKSCIKYTLNVTKEIMKHRLTIEEENVLNGLYIPEERLEKEIQMRELYYVKDCHSIRISLDPFPPNPLKEKQEERTRILDSLFPPSSPSFFPPSSSPSGRRKKKSGEDCIIL